MAELYLVDRPSGRTDLKNSTGLRGALVDAAIAAANALARTWTARSRDTPPHLSPPRRRAAS